MVLAEEEAAAAAAAEETEEDLLGVAPAAETVEMGGESVSE